LVASILVLAFACAKVESVRVGMSPNEVIRGLGEPDRKAVLEGKLLRDLDEIKDKDLTGYRVVYVYEKSGLQVWFQSGKVTGATRQGVSIFQTGDVSPDH